MCDLIKAAAFLDKDAIRETFLRIYPEGSTDICMIGILNIYYIVYANYVLANGVDFIDREEQKVCESVRQRSQEILDFFESTYPIDKSQRDTGFMQWANWMAESEDYTIQDEFDSPEDVLLKAGFRKIDLNLWLACQRYDLSQVRVLLDSGANPDVSIPYSVGDKDIPLPDEYEFDIETSSVISNAGTYLGDFFYCYDGFDYWKCGVNGLDRDIDDSYLPCLIEPAAYQIIYNTVLPYSKSSKPDA